MSDDAGAIVSGVMPSPLFVPGRPTVVYFVEGLVEEYHKGVFFGIARAAQDRGVNVAVAVGGSLDSSPWNEWERQRNCIYDMTAGLTLDGLIVSGSIGNFVTARRYREFLNRFSHLPMVSVSSSPSGKSVSIGVDNTAGMHELVEHCITVHGHRRFVFVSGPRHNREAIQRYEAFRATLDAHDITFDERTRLIAGDFNRTSGIDAAHHILNRKIKTDVVIGCNDETALGLRAGFTLGGMRVPEDIAVVGFDDMEEGRFVTPPLTTVRQPLPEIGAEALRMVLDMAGGKRVQGGVLPAQIVVRRSCGCSRSLATDTGRDVGRRASAGYLTRCATATLDAAQIGLDDDERVRVVSLYDDLLHDTTHPGGGKFLKSVGIFCRKIADSAEDATRWIEVLSQMHDAVAGHLDPRRKIVMERLLMHGILALREIAQRQEGFHRITKTRRLMDLRAVGEHLENALDMDQLLDAVHKRTVWLGITTCYLSLFEDASAMRSRLVLESRDGLRNPSGAEGGVFPTAAMVPEGIVNQPAPVAWTLYPLYFQLEKYGFIALRTQDCLVCEELQQFIGGALHSTLLVRKVQEQSAALTQANAELTVLRKKETAYIDAVNNELELGRRIQRGFLPEALPAITGWEIAAAFHPARVVSGDFYDTIRLDSRTIALVIADISGKGVGSALFMSLVRTLIRSRIETAGADLDQAIDVLPFANRYCIENHSRRDNRWMFATLFLGILDTESGRLTYVNAGHNPPVVVSGSQVPLRLAPTGPAIGINEQAVFNRQSVVLQPGDILFSYTDGVVESQSVTGEGFSFDRMREILASDHGGAQGAINAVYAEIAAHSAGAEQHDDITILAVKRA